MGLAMQNKIRGGIFGLNLMQTYLLFDTFMTSLISLVLNDCVFLFSLCLSILNLLIVYFAVEQHNPSYYPALPLCSRRYQSKQTPSRIEAAADEAGPRTRVSLP